MMKPRSLISKFEFFAERMQERNSLHQSIFANKNDAKIKITRKWQESLEDLLKHGYCRLPDSPLNSNNISALSSKTSKEENQIDYLSLLELFPPQNPSNEPNFNNYGKMAWDTVNIIPSLNNYNFMTKVHELLNLYYGRPYWIRNPSKVIIDSKMHRSTNHEQSFYHLDWGFHQLSLIILLNDTRNLSTRTRVIKSTHKSSHLLYDIPRIGSSNRFSKLNALRIKALEKLNGSYDLIGNAGTSFLIDAGNAFHKAIYGENRSIIHFNFAVNLSYANNEYTDKLTSNSINYLSKYNILDLLGTAPSHLINS